MKNKYIKVSHISEPKFREIVKLFSEDLSATQIANLTKLNQNTINRYLMLFRERIVKRSSANFLIKKVMQNATGRGESKTKARNESSMAIKSQSGHMISSKAHSIKSIQNLRSSEISGGSLNTYISASAKMVDNLNKIGVNTVERKDIHNIRTEFKKNNVNLSKVHTNRAYQHTEKIIEHIQASTPFF